MVVIKLVKTCVKDIGLVMNALEFARDVQHTRNMCSYERHPNTLSSAAALIEYEVKYKSDI